MKAAPTMLGLVLLVAAGRVETIRPAEEFAPPLPALAMNVMAGGRAAAAGSLVWVSTVQRLGDARYMAEGAPNLEAWLHTTMDLAPDFDIPPLFGALTLLTLGRADAADAILDRRVGGTFEVLYYRAIIAYFGRNDAPSAVKHLRAAAVMPLAPPFLAKWANRLEREGQDCRAMLQMLQGLQGGDASMRTLNANAVMIDCVRREIERAAATWRIQHGASPSVDELVNAGALARPPSPQGQCWTLEGPMATLRACP